MREKHISTRKSFLILHITESLLDTLNSAQSSTIISDFSLQLERIAQTLYATWCVC